MANGLPTIVKDYDRKTAIIDDHSVTITSYALGERYVCGIDNVEPGAAICRATGITREIAMAKALQQAVAHLREHRYQPVPKAVSSAPELAKLVLTGDPEVNFSVSDFLSLPMSDRMGHVLSGRLKYLDPQGASLASGEAIRLLKQASEALVHSA